MGRFTRVLFAVLPLGLIMLCGCRGLVPHDTQSLLVPKLHRSEIFGFLAGFGTTFAAVPDLVAMLKRRSSAGMNPRMAVIMGVFQILWVYYGLLIASRPRPRAEAFEKLMFSEDRKANSFESKNQLLANGCTIGFSERPSGRGFRLRAPAMCVSDLEHLCPSPKQEDPVRQSKLPTTPFLDNFRIADQD